jgi:acyl-CoA synthetase (AMP-forming)/AMP-acid ligase II
MTSAPDERLGEVVAAFVELDPDANVTADDLMAWCEGRIARFKTPRHIWFVEAGEWPMSATKVDKVPLRARVGDEVMGSAVPSARSVR